VGGRLLEAEGLFRRYGDTVALDGLSLSLDAGEFVALVGPSGCGKTTALRVLAGLEAPDAGRVLHEGIDITTTPPQQRPTNIVFQDLALFPHLSVAQNVSYGPRRRGLGRSERRARTGQLLELVGLVGFEDRQPSSLSGGQQQRVALARALANDPTVLLLDEPLSSLDRTRRRSLQLELKRIQRELGTTFLYVTHDQSAAMRMADRIGVMHSGQLVEVGAPEQLYARPRTAFTAAFLSDGTVLSPRAVDVVDASSVTIAGVQVPCADTNAGGSAVVAYHIPPGAISVDSGPLIGTVTDRAYGGTTTRLSIQVDDGPVVTVHQRNSTITPGSEITLSIDAVRPLIAPEGAI
jgi:ABC-type spermidine/putrescine transport systems, ATPase components